MERDAQKAKAGRAGGVSGTPAQIAGGAEDRPSTTTAEELNDLKQCIS